MLTKAEIEAIRGRLARRDWFHFLAGKDCEHGYAAPCPLCDIRCRQADIPALLEDRAELLALAKELAKEVTESAYGLDEYGSWRCQVCDAQPNQAHFAGCTIAAVLTKARTAGLLEEKP